jgi:hypothetical protein
VQVVPDVPIDNRKLNAATHSVNDFHIQLLWLRRPDLDHRSIERLTHLRCIIPRANDAADNNQ